MKKRLTAVLSLILALVMSFALVACDNGKGPGETEKPGGEQPPATAEMTEKAVDAVTTLFAEKGVKATVDIKLSSKLGADDNVDMSIPVEKSGNKLKATVPADEGGTATVVIDLDTGYSYTVVDQSGTATAVSYESVLPAGLYGYIEHMLNVVADGEDADFSEWDEKIEYDKDSQTVALSYDGVKQVNDFTLPLYDAYEKKSSLTTLLDDYFDLLSGGQMVFAPLPQGTNGMSFVTLAIDFVESMQDSTLGDILTTAKESYDIDVEKLLEDNDIDVAALLKEQFGIETTWEAIKARKLGDMIVGAYNALMQALTPPDQEVNAIAEGDEITDEDQSAGMASMLAAIINGALTGTPQEGQSAKAIAENLFNMLLVITNGLKTDVVIDTYIAPQLPELAEAIKSKVQITKANAKLSVKLNGDKLDTLFFKAELSHNYTKEAAEGFVFLADNDYKVEFTVKVSEISATPANIEFAYGDMSDVSYYAPDVVITGDTVTSDVKIFVELGGRQNNQGVTVDVGECEYVYNESFGDYVPSLVANENITYDKASSVVTIKAAYLAGYFAKAEAGVPLELCFAVTETVGSDTGEYVSTFNVILLSDDPQSIGDLFKNLIGGIAGGGNIGGTEIKPAA